jgi:S1-C subfamily serine protease
MTLPIPACSAQGRQRPIHYPFGYWVMSDEDGKPFAMPGDSGSAVIAGDGRVVGMVVAMQDAPDDPSALAFVIPIRPVLEAPEIVLIGLRPMGTLGNTLAIRPLG